MIVYSYYFMNIRIYELLLLVLLLIMIRIIIIIMIEGIQGLPSRGELSPLEDKGSGSGRTPEKWYSTIYIYIIIIIIVLYSIYIYIYIYSIIVYSI